MRAGLGRSLPSVAKSQFESCAHGFTSTPSRPHTPRPRRLRQELGGMRETRGTPTCRRPSPSPLLPCPARRTHCCCGTGSSGQTTPTAVQPQGPTRRSRVARSTCPHPPNPGRAQKHVDCRHRVLPLLICDRRKANAVRSPFRQDEARHMVDALLERHAFLRTMGWGFFVTLRPERPVSASSMLAVEFRGLLLLIRRRRLRRTCRCPPPHRLGASRCRPRL